MNASKGGDKNHDLRHKGSLKLNRKIALPPKPPKSRRDLFQKVKQIYNLLPESRYHSSVKGSKLKGKIKYFLFLIEPHWQLAKKSHAKAFIWAKTATVILWNSKRGKLILIQTGLIALLIFSLAWQYKPDLSKSLAQNAKNPEVKRLPIRRFLPESADYVPPKPFNPNSDFQTLPLAAWIAPWNLDDQRPNLDQYNSISAFWLTVSEDGANLQPKGAIEPFLDLVASLDREKTTLWLSVSGHPNDIFKTLTNKEIETQLITNLLNQVTLWQFDGIDIDFEMLGEDNRELFSSFIRQLTDQFHQANKQVSITLEARIGDPPMDWATIGDLADEVRIMLYDYHSRGTNNPGPIAPIGWVKEKLDYAKSTIPMEKLVVGQPNYGYDWQKNLDPNAKHPYEGTGVSFESAVVLASENNAPIFRAKDTDQRGFEIGNAPHFSYTDENNNEHQVWFEDYQSISAKLNLISQYQPKGVIFWHLGLGDTFLWQAQKDQELTQEKETQKSLLEEKLLEKNILLPSPPILEQSDTLPTEAALESPAITGSDSTLNSQDQSQEE